MEQDVGTPDSGQVIHGKRQVKAGEWRAAVQSGTHLRLCHVVSQGGLKTRIPPPISQETVILPTMFRKQEVLSVARPT